jgi:hypothetical protein
MPTATKKKVGQGKSVAKKVVALKTTTVKKRPSNAKADTKLALLYADNKRSFWVHDGQILNSLVALHDSFSRMNKTTFAHHVTKDRNDFAVWVDVVLNDSACAAGLMQAKTRTQAKAVVAKHLKSYQI